MLDILSQQFQLIGLSVLVLTLYGTGISFMYQRSKRQRKQEERIVDLLRELEREKEKHDLESGEIIGGELITEGGVSVGAYIDETLRLNKLRVDALQNLVESYHQQALGQAAVQFRISVVAAIIGFSLMIYGGFMQITSVGPATQALDVIAGLSPGFVINLIAGLFFNQARQTRDRGTALYDRLREDQRNRYAVEIADGIPEPVLKSFIYGQVALHIVGIKTSDVDLGALLPRDGLRPQNQNPSEKSS